MTKNIAKKGGSAGAAPQTSISTTEHAERTLRGVISSQIELLIEILDRIDGDWDAEPEFIETEDLEEDWLQPTSLGPKPRIVRRHVSRARTPGAAEPEQVGFQAEFSDVGQAIPLHPVARRHSFPGLRESVRDRLVRHGTDGPTDFELLGALLSLVMPVRRPEELASRLIQHFGSFSSALAAPVARLAVVEGMGVVSARNLKIILAAAKRFGRDQIDRSRPILSSWAQLLDYCHVTMAYEDVEHFRLLLLNRKNCLIADEVQQKGTIDHTPVYPREVIKRSLELSATAIILVHNHPSGDPTPSTADVRMTKEIIAAGRPLGIVVHDHLIIGRGGHSSLKALRLI
jgi:DNA repair protein RadC